VGNFTLLWGSFWLYYWGGLSVLGMPKAIPLSSQRACGEILCGGLREELATARAEGSLRDADPFVATGLPANFSNWVAWLFEPLFFVCKPPFVQARVCLQTKKGFSKAEATQP